MNSSQSDMISSPLLCDVMCKESIVVVLTPCTWLIERLYWHSPLSRFSSDAFFLTYVCSIRANERVYVFWAHVRIRRSKKRSTGNKPLSRFSTTRFKGLFSDNYKLINEFLYNINNLILKLQYLQVLITIYY